MGKGSIRGAVLAASLLSTAAGAQLVDVAQQPAGLVPAVAVVVEDAEPAVPEGGSPGYVPPARDTIGYITPNRNLSPEEVTWHVRVALNVAALGCRGADAAEMVGGYNALLTADKDMLAAASTAMGARYKARYGTAWQARHDDAMTKLYNFWALPPVQAKFCATALTVLREAATVVPAAFPAFAATALPRLEAPMLAFFADFDGYIVKRDAWRTRRARAMIAATVPADGAATAVAASPAAPVQAVAVAAVPVQAVAPVAAVSAPATAIPVATPVRFAAGAGEP